MITREQQEATRKLREAEHQWLLSYGWVAHVDVSTIFADKRYSHPAAPSARPSYTLADAMAMTNADKLRFAYPRPRGEARRA